MLLNEFSRIPLLKELNKNPHFIDFSHTKINFMNGETRYNIIYKLNIDEVIVYGGFEFKIENVNTELFNHYINECINVFKKMTNKKFNETYIKNEFYMRHKYLNKEPISPHYPYLVDEIIEDINIPLKKKNLNAIIAEIDKVFYKDYPVKSVN